MLPRKNCDIYEFSFNPHAVWTDHYLKLREIRHRIEDDVLLMRCINAAKLRCMR
jgi:hypothetical protein